MRKILFALLVLMMLAVSALAATKELASPEAKVLLAKTKNMFLLDVRTPQEFKQGRLPGATLIPLGELERRLNEVPKNRPILVYCAVGARSRTAAGLLSQHGYQEVYNLGDGIVGWYRNGLPIYR